MSSEGPISRSKDGVPQWDGDSASFSRFEEEALLWQESIAWQKRYMCGPKLIAELSGAAKRMIIDKPANWVSFNGGVELLLGHLRECLGRPQVTELTEYLNQYFRNSRRKPGETINSYVTRKTEIYMRARQALRRLKPHQEAQVTNARTTPSVTAPPSRRMSWTSETEGATAEGATEEVDAPEQEEPEDPWRSWRGSWGNTQSQWNNWQWQSNSWSWAYSMPWYNGDRTSWATSSNGSWSQPATQADTSGTDQLLPDWVQGWYLLQDAGLTAGERNMIYTALKGEFSMNRVAQELRNQWPEHEIKRHDQQHRASGFLGQVDEISDDEEDNNVSFPDQELSDEGQALLAEHEDQAADALAVIQQAKKTLKEARAKQHSIRMSRKYYRSGPSSTSGGSSSNAGSRDDSHITCLRCGRTGHRAANCDQPPTFQKREAAPFVCYAQAEAEDPEPQAWATGLARVMQWTKVWESWMAGLLRHWDRCRRSRS